MDQTHTAGDRITWNGNSGTIVREARPISAEPDVPSYIVRLDGGLSVRLTPRQMDAAR